MDKDMKQWEKEQGVVFLRKTGIKIGQTVLDFGCRTGHYTIPAAKAVGNRGIVYAMDKEQQALAELRRKAVAYKLTNIKVMKTSGQIKLPLENGTVDVILLYDVLHYLRKDERAKLYHEAFRLLRQDGFLSVYPKHTLEDDPIREFRSVSLNDVKKEIEDSNFVFKWKHCGLISHDDGLNHGYVLNFRKYE
jgi:ubiquinone/menaquinone biosynthesis C-methylase UbiE